MPFYYRFCISIALTVLATSLVLSGTVAADDDPTTWPELRSTFPSTGGGGFMIKGYDPVITGSKCITTFMAVEPGSEPKVYPNVVEFDATPESDGIVCSNGRWRSFDGAASGTTPFRLFFRNGKFYAPAT